MGLEYTPINNVQLIATKYIQTKFLCSAACNQESSCRIFDYDLISKRCRLFEGDSTTGSINLSSSPTSIVGVVSISSSIYSSINNQLCQAYTTNALTMPFDITVAGGCNGSSSTNQTLLINQAGILLGSNNTLYVGDNSDKLYSFYINNRTGHALRSYSS
ncbi:unnamed protein product [Rotaria socialis]|uniref:Apple domain-containing protein n=1 Tax=Rotaria socialis TaxID=392032 RepID=A0A821GD74_9BILA|nr:unnamed protein product [Rotaria socialis]CAF4146772.1 unnamed protein product [Rotaria socialis]CAF4284612.1 unnamed protein product [Rotaria socialis]CAF4387650.1 unnamed protein product [Rotaria socialis]CAF4486903.1 unnamed protein product [Rotaria socialis]